MDNIQIKHANKYEIDCLAFCESGEQERGVLAICDSSGVISFYSFIKQNLVKLFCFELFCNNKNNNIERIVLEMRDCSIRFIVQRQFQIVSSEWISLNGIKSFERDNKNNRNILDFYTNALVNGSLEDILIKKDNKKAVDWEKKTEDDNIFFIHPKLNIYQGSFSSPSYFFFETTNNPSVNILRFDNNGNIYLSVLNKNLSGENNEMVSEAGCGVSQWSLINKLGPATSSTVFNVIQTLSGYVVLINNSLSFVHLYNFSCLWIFDLTFHILDIFIDNSFLNLAIYDEEKRNILFEIPKISMLKARAFSANKITVLPLIFNNYLNFINKKQLLQGLLKDFNETNVYTNLLNEKMNYEEEQINKLHINRQNMRKCVEKLKSGVFDKKTKYLITEDLINLMKKVTLNHHDLHMLMKVALHADQQLILTLKFFIQRGLKEIESGKLLLKDNVCNIEISENDLIKLLQQLKKVENDIGNNLLVRNSVNSMGKNLLNLLRQGRVQSLLLYWRRNIFMHKENIVGYIENSAIFNKLLNSIPDSLPHDQVEVLLKEFLIPMVVTHRDHLEMLMDWTETYATKIQFSQNWPTNAIKICRLFISWDCSHYTNCYRDVRREAWMMVQTGGLFSISATFFSFYRKLLRVDELFKKAGVMVSLQMIDSDLVKYKLLEKTLDELGENQDFHEHFSWLGPIDRDDFLLTYLAEHSLSKNVNKSVKVISIIQKTENKLKGVLSTLRWCFEIPPLLMSIINPLLNHNSDLTYKLKTRLKTLWMKSLKSPSSHFPILKEAEAHIRNGLCAITSGQTHDQICGLDEVFKLAQYINYPFEDLLLEWMEAHFEELRFFSRVEDFVKEFHRQAILDSLNERQLKLLHLRNIAKKCIELVYLRATSPWTTRVSALRHAKMGLRMLQEIVDYNISDDCTDDDFFIFYYTNLLKDIENNKDEVEKEKQDEEDLYIKAFENDLQFGFESLYEKWLGCLDDGLNVQVIMHERQHYKKYLLFMISDDALDEILRKQEIFKLAIDIYKCSYEHMKFTGACNTQFSELPFKWSSVLPHVVRVIKCLFTNLKDKNDLLEELNVAWNHLKLILQSTNHHRIIISTFVSINYILFFSKHVIVQKIKKGNYQSRLSKTDDLASSSSIVLPVNHHSNEQNMDSCNKITFFRKFKMPLVCILKVLESFLDSYFNQSFPFYISHVYIALTSFFIFSQAIVAFSDLFKNNDDKSHAQLKITEVMMLYSRLQHIDESSFKLLYVNAQWLSFCSIYNIPFAHLHCNNHPSTLVLLVMHTSVDFSVTMLFMKQFKISNHALSCLLALLSALQNNKRQKEMIDYTKKLILLIKIIRNVELPLKRIINTSSKLNIIKLFMTFLPQEDKVIFYRSLIDFTISYDDYLLPKPSMMCLIDQAPSIVSSHINSSSINSWLTVYEYLDLNVDDLLLTCVRNDLKLRNRYSDDMTWLISYIEDSCKSLKLLTWLREDMKEMNENMMEKLVSTCVKCDTATSLTAAKMYKKQLQHIKLVNVFAKHGFHSSISTHNKNILSISSDEDSSNSYNYISYGKDSDFFKEDGVNYMNDPEGGWMCAIKRLFSQFSIANTYAYDALQDLVHTLCLNSDTVYMKLTEEWLNSNDDEHLELLDYLFHHLDVAVVQRILFRYINKINENTSLNLCRGSKRAIGVLRALRCLCRVSTPFDVLQLMHLDDVQSLVELLTDLIIMCILADRKETFDAFRLMDKHSLARSLLMLAEKSNNPFISVNVATMISCYRIKDASMTSKVLHLMNLHGLFQSASAFSMHWMTEPDSDKRGFTTASLMLFSNALTHYHYNFKNSETGSFNIDEKKMKFQNTLKQCFNVLVCLPGSFSIWLQEKIDQSNGIKDDNDVVEVIKCMDLLKLSELTDLRVCFSILCKDDYSLNNIEKESKNKSYSNVSLRINEALKILHEINPPNNLFLLSDLFSEHIPKHFSNAFNRLMVETRKETLLLDQSLIISDYHSFLEASYTTTNDLSATILN